MKGMLKNKRDNFLVAVETYISTGYVYIQAGLPYTTICLSHYQSSPD
jgi:hypothetical protein